MQCGQAKLTEWEEIVQKIKNPQGIVKVALIGKYVDFLMLILVFRGFVSCGDLSSCGS